MADQSVPTLTRGSSSQPDEAEKEYEDLMSVMAEKLDSDDFMQELSAGFRLLSDEHTGKITPASLLRGAAAALGLHGMTAEEAEAMVKEGDMDGDGALNESEFCVLMVRLSPGLMEDAEALLEREIDVELERVASRG
ncbi:Calcium-binding protein KIC [Rhynchospora pubera]|uniref:Calcium-binding protein KIC n=1 Tax=Rhynchospora pubera TaxID=906938 RepID=A0AAV8H846_9POAL|nr:Calcium-binding protein KIC [Rhynchospora pubera]KAJ4759476.1 Calcium-binding protein KIC [Rhynchospora pubera]KAJ4811947.1 Calcium-binding protein KIC [Rhynchospora pubera]